jgi:hypothetical protein
MTTGVQLAQTAGIVLAAIWTMVYAGTKKRRLTLRQDRRRCPSCGVVITGRSCQRH